MPLLRLEHYLVLSDDIDGTRDFYCDVLGMREWESYAVWTKEVGIPISSRAKSTGAVDHIAFNASGFDEVRARLQARGLEIHSNLLDEIGLRQLFIYDPNGVPIELNFRS